MTERIPPLEGGRNFRDLGGYPTEDGRVVRWGQLYRSGAMSALTEADYRYLASLRIAAICDFRATRERDSEPTLWPGPDAPAMYARDYDMRMASVRAAVDQGERTAAAMETAMIGFYADLAYEHAESYQLLFNAMLEGRLPLVFNCSAGKDRTGVAAALILSLLGVPREHILDDYSLSEKLVDFEGLAARAGASDTATGFTSLKRFTPEARAPLLRSNPAYLIHALEEIERREGSIANFLQSQFGVGPRETEALRGALLQPA
jgi:protein-tyrosine phosphatase